MLYWREVSSGETTDFTENIANENTGLGLFRKDYTKEFWSTEYVGKYNLLIL